MSAPVITVSAVVLRNSAGQVLCVRKRGTSAFMFPGGKPEPGEAAVDAAVREVREELGLGVGPEDLRHLGRWRTRAANEAGHDLVGEVFEWSVPEGLDWNSAGAELAALEPQAEIEELRWLDPRAEYDAEEVAALTRECVFPVLASRE